MFQVSLIYVFYNLPEIQSVNDNDNHNRHNDNEW